MGDADGLLLRPPRAQGGLRPPARRGGTADADLSRILLLALAFWLAGAGSASADTLTLAQYSDRLVTARGLIDRSRAATTAERTRLLAQARDLLRQTTALRVAGEVVAINDGPVADLAATSDGATRAVAILDSYIATANRTNRIDPAVADARLREIASQQQTQSGGDNTVGAVIFAFLEWLQTGIGRIANTTADLVSPVIVVLGAAIVLFIVATLGRNLPERIRTEVVVAGAGNAEREDPAVHLRLADQALAGGHAREAIREVYLYAIAALAAREVFRYDPALTDRELLARAAGIPHADALATLVALYERAWFGLREPATAEADRARTLAVEAVT